MGVLHYAEVGCHGGSVQLLSLRLRESYSVLYRKGESFRDKGSSNVSVNDTDGAPSYYKPPVVGARHSVRSQQQCSWGLEMTTVAVNAASDEEEDGAGTLIELTTGTTKEKVVLITVRTG